MCLFLVSCHLAHRTRQSYLFVQEVEISGTLILDVFGLISLVAPVSFLFPLIVFLLFKFGRVVKRILLLGLLAVYIYVSTGVVEDWYFKDLLLRAAGSVWNRRVTPCSRRGQPCCTLTGTS